MTASSRRRNISSGPRSARASSRRHAPPHRRSADRVINSVLQDARLNRLLEGEAVARNKNDAYSLVDMIDDMQPGLWSELYTRARSIRIAASCRTNISTSTRSSSRRAPLHRRRWSWRAWRCGWRGPAVRRCEVRAPRHARTVADRHSARHPEHERSRVTSSPRRRGPSHRRHSRPERRLIRDRFERRRKAKAAGARTGGLCVSYTTLAEHLRREQSPSMRRE